MSAADSCMWQLSSQPLTNPALKQCLSPRSESMAGIKYLHDKNNARPIAAEGDKYSAWQGYADTYLKLSGATVWGNARYTNYTRRSVIYNESLHPMLIYPYLSADTVGGPLYGESYRFGGGYSSSHNHWSWGVCADYTAEMCYRDIDPRPECISGNLNLTAGGAYRLKHLYIGLSGQYQHYTQSIDIDFKSETGKEKIYQLTGLGSHYKRFAGTSDNSYFKGNRWKISADIYPHNGNGLSASLSYGKSKIIKSLIDLNNLPLAHIGISDYSLSCAWIKNCWGIGLTAIYNIRTGYENLFGLPDGDNYPLITTLEMYHQRNTTTAITGIWQKGTCHTPFYMSVRLKADYSDNTEKYDNKSRYRSIKMWGINANIFLSKAFNTDWRLSTDTHFRLTIPTSSSLILTQRTDTDKAEQKFIESERHRFTLLSSRQYEWNMNIKLSRRIYQKLTASAAVNFRQTIYNIASPSASYIDISLSAIF